MPIQSTNHAPQNHEPQVEVVVRVLRLSGVVDGSDEPAVIVTTFVNGRLDEREIYDQRGQEISHETSPPQWIWRLCE